MTSAPNKTAEYMKGLSLVYPQSNFYHWQLNESKKVTITSFMDNPELKKIILGALGEWISTEDYCFENAIQLCYYDKRIKYVEGVATVDHIPTEHAWNYFEGIYFDLTAEIVFDGLGFSDYYQVINIPISQVKKLATSTEIPGWVRKIYNDKVAKIDRSKR